MHSVTITNVTVEELIGKLKETIPVPLVIKPGKQDHEMIIVLNKRSAAHTLDISEELFCKLQKRGLIPCTVHAGFSKDKKPVMRWAEHHLRMIKPEIQKLKYNQDEDLYLKARVTINKILGL